MNIGEPDPARSIEAATLRTRAALRLLRRRLSSARHNEIDRFIDLASPKFAFRSLGSNRLNTGKRPKIQTNSDTWAATKDVMAALLRDYWTLIETGNPEHWVRSVTLVEAVAADGGRVQWHEETGFRLLPLSGGVVHSPEQQTKEPTATDNSTPGRSGTAIAPAGESGAKATPPPPTPKKKRKG